MIVETQVGKVTVTAETSDLSAPLLVTTDQLSTLQSVLDLIELVGGAEGEDVSFTSDDVTELQLFGKTYYRATLSRGQVSRWLDAELHNYLDYSSVVKMRKQSAS